MGTWNATSGHGGVPSALIAGAVSRLRAGGLVAFPTETVYGLGADARSDAAVARVFSVKRRPPANPLIVHTADEAGARELAAGWSEQAAALARAFWPGPLTLVLPRRAGAVADAAAAGGPTVALRVPDHPVALALLRAFGGPLVGPSANPSGYVSPTRAEHVRAHFDADEVLTLDGGPCRAGIESTVVWLCGTGRPRVLRSGVIGPGQIAAALGAPVDAMSTEPGGGHGGATGAAAHDGGFGGGFGGGPVASPGLIGPHYRPLARVVLADSAAEAEGLLASAAGPGLLLSPPGVPQRVSPPHASLAMPADASAYAAELYAALREADDFGATVVVVCRPPRGGVEEPVWAAVAERLSRAAM